MPERVMVVTFRRQGRGCSWTALRPPRTVVPGPTMAAGGDLPHDLHTFVIGDALGIEYGFWGCVAAGATFKSLGRKRTPQGKTVIARHVDDLDAAEARVNEIYFAWRTGEPTPLDGELDSMLSRWAGVGRRRRTGPPVADPPAGHAPTSRLPALVGTVSATAITALQRRIQAHQRLPADVSPRLP